MSDGHKGEAHDRKRGRRPEKEQVDKKPRKNRGNEIGRALRTVYDDTLREPVPDDFTDLLGKLS